MAACNDGTTVTESFGTLLARVRACHLCDIHLPLGCRPVLQASPRARLLIVSQAPGRRVHETGIPFNDPSGDRLRDWLGIDKTTFYDAEHIAIVPMGFCYPGRGADGDLPPRPECAPLWLPRLLPRLPRIELTLLVGQYAQRRFLGRLRKPSLAETTAAWRDYAPRFMPLPHPSPRNQPWLARHRWFERDVLPALRARIGELV